MVNKKIIEYIICLIILICLPVVFSGPYYLHIFILTMLNMILACSLRLINLSGQLSLAHGGMMTLGAYTSTLLVMRLGFSSWLGLLSGGFAAAAIAFLIGIPFVRLKGIYFSIVSLLLGEMIVLTALQWRDLTGGSMGLFGIPRPDPIHIPGLFEIIVTTKQDFYYLAFALLIISLLIMYAIERSRVGLTFLGIKQADLLAESVGISTAYYKILAFTCGSFFAGISGAFHSQYISVITPDSFGFIFTIYIFIYMTVGGAQKFSGPVIGALFLTLLPEAIRDLKSFTPFIFAGTLIAVIFFMPEGMTGIPSRLKCLVRRRFPRKVEHA